MTKTLKNVLKPESVRWFSVETRFIASLSMFWARAQAPDWKYHYSNTLITRLDRKKTIKLYN